MTHFQSECTPIVEKKTTVPPRISTLPEEHIENPDVLIETLPQVGMVEHNPQPQTSSEIGYVSLILSFTVFTAILLRK
jgi:hypothetical protein